MKPMFDPHFFDPQFFDTLPLNYPYYSIDVSGLNPYEVINCDFCGKCYFVKNNILKTIEDIIYNLCEFCNQFVKFEEVQVAYAEHIANCTSGLYPTEVDWL